MDLTDVYIEPVLGEMTGFLAIEGSFIKLLKPILLNDLNAFVPPPVSIVVLVVYVKYVLRLLPLPRT
jgi:hypothetical protein